jgi:hypothetical protein
MRKAAVLALMAALLAVPAGSPAKDDAPKAPAPKKEHEWLKQLEGEWETVAEMVMAPGKPAVTSKGTEKTRTLGGFWSIGEYKGECMGVSVTGSMTIGYDAKKKKYVGTWVCSMSDWLCQYEGTAKGQVLTLECEGPNPVTGKTVKMRDVIELKGKDRRC